VRIEEIKLAWFRGAASSVSLESKGRSTVVYGLNGAGKSSFVDGIEYISSGGKISHLAHEYSGKNLINSVPNTHKPSDAQTEVMLTFSDGSEAKTAIRPDGSHIGLSPIKGWEYRRAILRQDEVAAFIKETKGGKYSALLPLLGLQPLEIAAENLRQLARNVKSLSQLESSKASLAQTETRRLEKFGTDNDEQIHREIGRLHQKYCAESHAQDQLLRCKEILEAIDSRIRNLNQDQKRHLALSAAGALKLKVHIEAVRVANSAIAGMIDPLVGQKIAVLKSTEALARKLPSQGEVPCPACGQVIQLTAFRAHVTEELELLQGIMDTFNTRNAAIADLCDAVKTLRTTLAREEVTDWRATLTDETWNRNFTYLENVNAEALRSSCEESDLEEIERKLLPIVEAASQASKDSPSEVQELLIDRGAIEVAKIIVPSADLVIQVARTEVLVLAIEHLERGTRNQIKVRSNSVITEISEDIKRMWLTLHPGEAIENVHLYLPKDVDKAIDIGLKFHGKDMDSPRLTLSEGYRNSLGLCIFLAMAKHGESLNDPIILDDVVVSLDRNHRGMIVDLLKQEFADRQVIVMTHDRDWYTELRQQLDDGKWLFKALLPYETPELGIRWSHGTSTFDDARGQLSNRPDSAGNTARKIMDIELALISERLQLRLPYLRFEKNDRRLAHDFLERLIGDGKKCFQTGGPVDFRTNEEGIRMLSEADKLLLSWGNRASHSFDIVRPEAQKLIDTCESALASFRCDSCKRNIWFADAANSEWVQCQCGKLRWRYGKG
jgi:RecF/RecN/SMC N terminal domain